MYFPVHDRQEHRVHGRFAVAVLVAGLLWPVEAEAQHGWCGGHRIEWVGGAPRAGLGPAPPGGGRADRSAGADRRGSGAYGPTDEDGTQPTVEEPAGLNRERWDQLVFNAREQRYRTVQTRVLAREQVPQIQVCMQSPETSVTGERLAPYAEVSWWRRHIGRWTGLSWSGEIRVAACTEEPPEGWIYVREAKPSEMRDDAIAFAHTRREFASHGGPWLSSELVFIPNFFGDEEYFEKVLAHELGHALGFWHVTPESGYAMAPGVRSTTWPEEENELAQLAYRVGPNVKYPGLLRDDPETEPGGHPDVEALEAVYESTGGEQWADDANWVSEAPLDRWHGIATGEGGRVVELDLHANKVTGEIPAEIGELESLETLVLYQNALTGSLPAEIGELAGLVDLEMFENALTGPLPAALGRLSNLKTLSVARNQLTGRVPPELGVLTNLLSLHLHDNELSGPIPPELGDLGNLWGLRLESNNLTGRIPPELGRLSELTSLRLGGNALTGPIPAVLGDLSNLWYLDLSSNRLSGPVPAELGGLSLSSLRLSGNRLTGPLPASLTDLELKVLYIDDNAGLCAPADEAFQAWLATVTQYRGETCAAEPVPALPAVGVALAAVVVCGLAAAVVRRRRRSG